MAPVRLVGAVLVLATLALFAQVSGFDFVNYDDPQYVTDNPQVTRGVSAEGAAWAFRTFHFSNWHPLTWLSHMLDCSLFGLNPGGHHLVNVLLHVLNVALLYAWLVRVTACPWSAAVVAALFAWHPLRVESVAWISERKDVLCATFGLLALHAYAAYAREPRPRRLALVTFWFALGLMAKPMLVTLPCVLLLLDRWPLGRWPLAGAPATAAQRCVLEKWPLYLLTVISCVLTVAAQRAEAIRTIEEVPVGLRIGNAVLAYATYLTQTFWPVDLAVLYPLRRVLPLLPMAGALALLGGVTLLAWRERQRRPWLLIGWLWFAGMLVPVSGLVAVGGQSRADRYLYLPQIGLFIMMAWTGREWVLAGRVPRRAATVAAGLALAACAALTWRQVGFWRDSETLFQRALAVVPDNTTAYINLGAVLERQGRLEEALTNYLAALRLEPGRAATHNNLGNVLDGLGRHAEAIEHYHEALRLKPGTALVHRNLGAALVAQRRYDEAMAQYAEAQRLMPADPENFHLAGVALLRQGRTRAGIDELRRALRLDSNRPRVLYRLARVLATDEDPSVRDGAEAVRLAIRAVDLTAGQQPQVLDTLGMALAAAGRFDEAIVAARQAADLLEAIGQPQAAAPVRARLALYQARQPFLEPIHEL